MDLWGAIILTLRLYSCKCTTFKTSILCIYWHVQYNCVFTYTGAIYGGQSYATHALRSWLLSHVTICSHDEPQSFEPLSTLFLIDIFRGRDNQSTQWIQHDDFTRYMTIPLVYNTDRQPHDWSSSRHDAHTKYWFWYPNIYIYKCQVLTYIYIGYKYL